MEKEDTESECQLEKARAEEMESLVERAEPHHLLVQLRADLPGLASGSSSASQRHLPQQRAGAQRKSSALNVESQDMPLETVLKTAARERA